MHNFISHPIASGLMGVYVLQYGQVEGGLFSRQAGKIVYSIKVKVYFFY